MDLFRHPPPLAERVRPKTFEEFVGQEQTVATLRALAEARKLPSIILWGPPGCGKTTLAKLLARTAGLPLELFSAVTSGISDVRETVRKAREQGRTVLLIDELHRFNRAQQDAFLPHVEDGTLVLIGATTENPSFGVNAPLLSRCRVFRLDPPGRDELSRILDRGIRELGDVTVEPAAREEILTLSGGDARVVLNLLEMSASLGKSVTAELVRRAAQGPVPRYDRDREEHFNTISAFIKSMRGSDPDAALYWLARMIEAGEDPLFIARRMVIFASEDIGNADPQALPLAVAAFQAVHFVGMPEGAIPLAHAALYLASSEKSKAAYRALEAAREDARRTAGEPVPLHLRNPATPLMREHGYGAGYRDPQLSKGVAPGQAYLPPPLQGRRYYNPTGAGAEGKIRRFLEELRRRATPPSSAPSTRGPRGS